MASASRLSENPIERHHVRAGALRFGVEYPDLSQCSFKVSRVPLGSGQAPKETGVGRRPRPARRV